MGVFQKGKKNSKYSYLDEKLRRLDEDLKKTGLVSGTKVQENVADLPKITLPKNPSKEDIRLVSEYLDIHSKSNWRNDYRLENSQKTTEEIVEEEISKLRLQRKPQKKLDCSTCVTESDLKSKKIIKEEVTFEDKVNKILQIYNEGLLNIPPSENTPDPLTPTDGKFVTFSQLNDHYNLFINRIQQQLSTLGGGGEVRLQYLDDIVGIATNASAYDGKYLKYNDTLGKFEFSDVITGLTTETQTLNNVLNLGNTSALGMSVGVITATSFNGDGSSLSGIITSLVGYSTEGYVDAAVAGVSTFSGSYNDLTDKPAIPSIVGLASEGYVDSAVVGLVTTGYVDSAVVGLVTTGYVDSAVVGLASTGYVDAAISGIATTAFSGSYNDLTDKPTIPADTGDLTNNVGFVTSGIVNGYSTISYVDNAVAGIVSAAPSALDTLNELAAALGDDANFATTVTNSLASKADLSGANFTGVVTATSFSGSATKINIGSGGAAVQYPLFAQNYGASANNIVYNDQHLSYNQNSNTLILQNISASGVITATDFNSSSDIALKENVEVIDNPLDKLLELRGVTFDWKETKKSGVGVVAQDVEKVLPQAVGGSEDHKTVNYNAIIGLLVESVKQQQKEIEDLRKRLS